MVNGLRYMTNYIDCQNITFMKNFFINLPVKIKRGKRHVQLKMSRKRHV